MLRSGSHMTVACGGHDAETHGMRSGSCGGVVVTRRTGTWLVSSILAAVVLCGTVLSGQEFQGQVWRVVSTTDPETGVETRRAIVGDESDFSFTVAPGAGGRSATCSFGLPDGESGSLDSQKLPVFEVDDLPPQTVVRWGARSDMDEIDGGDFMEVGRRAIGAAPLLGVSASGVQFRCWAPLPGQVSPTRGLVRQLLDGRRLVVRFDLRGDRHGETGFDLRGAREAIAEALGTTPDPTPLDLAQDELLQLRVRYRRNTCYLLQGRKRQRRCLESVNDCASLRHDSVLSMLGCIEGN